MAFGQGRVRISNRFGAGVYGPMDNHRERIPTANLSTAFQTEVMGVLRRIELLLSKKMSAVIAGQQWQHLQKPQRIGPGMGEYASARRIKWI